MPKITVIVDGREIYKDKEFHQGFISLNDKKCSGQKIGDYEKDIGGYMVFGEKDDANMSYIIYRFIISILQQHPVMVSPIMHFINSEFICVGGRNSY